MTTQHTPGRLKVGRHGAIVGGPEFEFVNGSGVKQLAMTCVVPEGVDGDQESNARRLVAAWNACEGVPTEKLENFAAVGAIILSQRDELVEALAAFLRAPSVGSDKPGSSTIVVQDFNLRAARAAIAKVEVGAASPAPPAEVPLLTEHERKQILDQCGGWRVDPDALISDVEAAVRRKAGLKW